MSSTSTVVRSMPDPAIALSPTPVMPPPAADALSCLTHYRTDYPYQSERYVYTETETSDPHYVVAEVRLTAPAVGHGWMSMHLGHALPILATAAPLLAGMPWHFSTDADVTGIPAVLFGATPHTGILRPDFALWPFAPPAADLASYAFDPHRVPWLGVEVVSHSSSAVRDNDWVHKYRTYAHMGIREYWLLDRQETPPLCVNVLKPGADGRGAYRRVLPAADDGVRSPVFGRTLRWRDARLQYREARTGAWRDVSAIPLRAAQVKERAAALLMAARQAGALVRPADHDRYLAHLQTLDLAQLPTPDESLAYLQAYPEGPQRAAAAARWLDRCLAAAGDGSDPKADA